MVGKVYFSEMKQLVRLHLQSGNRERKEDGHVQSNLKARSPWFPTVKPNLKTQLNLQTKYADTCIYKIQFTLHY